MTAKEPLQARLIRALEYYDCRPATLARAAGVSQAIVHKVKTGQQRTVSSDNYDLLQPYLSLTMPKDYLSGVGRKPKPEASAANFQMP